jgi:uncharacterized phage protein gp47/JayE
VPNIPKPESYQAIFQKMSQTFVAKSGVNDLNRGSVIRDILETAALSDFKSQGDVIAALNSTDIDRAESNDLDQIGIAESVSRPQARQTTGVVTINHKTITKVSTKVYAGTAAPPMGSVTINISSNDGFPNSGSVYLGRGSNNVEGPIVYSSITIIGNYFQLALSSPTTKNHNLNESVILAQGGDRVISAGSSVRTKQNSTSSSVNFTILNTVTIADGEDNISDVPVVCSEVGTKGNVKAGAISEFSSDPFPGSGVSNLTDFVTGRDKMSDVDYRLLIKSEKQNRTKGTDLAIKAAAVGVQSLDDNKTVASAEIRKPANRLEPATLFIDDGTAYQPIFNGQGFEQIIENANGGEKFLQLQREDITKALVETSFSAPFSLTGAYMLSVIVGGVLSEHTFSSGDFTTQNASDTFEVVNSINANTSLLFSARASNNSKNIILFAKNFSGEDIQLTIPSNLSATDANDYLGFPTNLVYSLRLYKNDLLLIKDGVVPSVLTKPQSSWSVIVSSKTLIVQLDKQSSAITYTFSDADFVPFGYATMLETVPLSVWADVFNSIIPGVTAVVEGNRLNISSNKGANDDGKIIISGGTLKTLIFDGAGDIESVGKTSDYSLNRSTGQIELSSALSAGDNVTAGSKNTRGFITSSELISGTVTLSAGSGTAVAPKLWVILDDINAEYIVNTATAGTTITITNPSTNKWRFTSSDANAFVSILAGDWVVVADDAIHTFDPDFIGHFRVAARTNSSFDIYLTQSLGSVSGALSLLGNSKITFVRSSETIQPLSLPTGLNTLTAIANQINSVIEGGNASVSNGKLLKLTTNTFSLSGSVILVALSSNADSLGLLPGTKDDSTVTHTAFSESGNSENTIPAFVHDVVATGSASVPATTISSTLSLLSNGSNQNDILKFLNPYGKESSNKGAYTQIQNISGTTVNLRSEARIKDVIAGDRFYISKPFDFTSDDNLVVILDRDGVNKALNIKMGRKASVATVIAQDQLTAYDADAGPTADYANQFGDNFSFNDFKIHLKARQIVDPSGSNNKFLLRSSKFGPTGEMMRFGIDYPSGPNAAITSTVFVKKYTDMKVFLASGSERLGGSWDNTSQFDVTNPSGDTYRYNWNGTGTAPAFVGAGVAIDDIVTISQSSNFDNDNIGVFKVSAVTTNYFEITNFYGVLETNIQLNAASELRFYPLDASANKASDLQTYVTANLSAYVSIAQLQSGTGVISLSTFDEQSGSSQYVNLVDGENWILLSNIGTTAVPVNQFNLKKNLSLLESDPDYTLVGEEFYIIPTLSSNIVRFLNIFAVTGLSSLGNIVTSEDAGRVQIYSNLFGTSGAVQVSGGSANQAAGAVETAGAAANQANLRNQPIGIIRSGSTVTVYTLDRHDLSIGDSVIISGVENSNFDGSFVITAITAKSLQYTQSYSYASFSATPSGATRSGGVITFNTATAHKLVVGDEVSLSSVDNTTFDGTYIVISTPTSTQFTVNTSNGDPIIDVSPTGAVRLTNVVTITTTAPHNIQAGDQVVVAGITDSSFNGTFTVATAGASTFTYAQVAADATSGSGSITSVSTGSGQIDSIASGEGSVAIPYAKFDISAANRAGLQANQWIKIENTEVLQKDLSFDVSTQIQLQNSGLLGRVTRSVSGTFQTSRTHSGNGTTGIKLSKQGQFVCISFNGTGTAPNFVGGGVQEGDWVRLQGNFNANNEGIYQIIKMFGSNSFYIINDNAIEEEITLSAGSDLSFYSYDSVMPGDKLIISTDVLNINNKGTYIVDSSTFPTSTDIYLTTPFASTVGPVALGTDFTAFIIKEATPFLTYRKMLNIIQDPNDSEAYSVIVDTEKVGNKISPSVGASILASSKFAFSTTVQTGEDSYKYYGGLISAVGKKIRGQSEDPVGFPGVAAAGSYIEITSPLPREITISIVIKNLSGIPFSTIKSRVQSAVSSYVNNLGVGESVVFSQIISTVQEINGVQALAISAPTYDATNLQVVLNEDEKAVITNINNITVSLSS